MFERMSGEPPGRSTLTVERMLDIVIEQGALAISERGAIPQWVARRLLLMHAAELWERENKASES